MTWVFIRLAALGLAFWAGYALAVQRFKRKVDDFVADHSKYEDDNNPPGSL